MRIFPALFAATVLAGCGADVASTAATAAALKKQEIEQGKKTQDQFQQKIGQAVEQMQQGAQRAADSADK
jgi:hypothetical protein